MHDGVSPQRLAVKQDLGTRLLESAAPPSPVPIQARHQRFDTRELGDYENQLSASPPQFTRRHLELYATVPGQPRQ